MISAIDGHVTRSGQSEFIRPVIGNGFCICRNGINKIRLIILTGHVRSILSVCERGNAINDEAIIAIVCSKKTTACAVIQNTFGCTQSILSACGSDGREILLSQNRRCILSIRHAHFIHGNTVVSCLRDKQAIVHGIIGKSGREVHAILRVG